ncbi:MAG: ESX-1 secretion-associated protein [Carbonactinosporaceae bacterium]
MDVSSGRFRAEPEQIWAGGRGFIEATQTDLASAIQAFAAQARNVGDAFGTLPESDEMKTSYLESTEQTLRNLEQLRETLEHVGDALMQTAVTYQQDDADATMPGGN